MSDKKELPERLRRRYAEAFAWVFGVAFLWTVDTLAKLSVRDQTGIGKGNFKLITDQATSAVAALIMISFVVYWLRQFPLEKARWLPAAVGHAVGTAVFAFGHYSLMVLFRVIVHRLNGLEYHWVSGYVPNLIVEYQKDLKIYFGIVVVVLAYQFYRRARSQAPPPTSAAQKLVVQTGNGESIVRVDDIDYLEASRNYIAVHAGGREYLLRDTMANIENRFSGSRFARVHRSYMVNVEKIAEINSVDGGQQITLSGGARLPVSRRYREALRLMMTS